MTKKENEKIFSAELESFSQWIKVPKQDVVCAKQVANTIFDVLRESGKYTIDRCRFGGSLEKETATVLKVDVDVVVFVNPRSEWVDLNDPDSILLYLATVRDHWMYLLYSRIPGLEFHKNLKRGKNTIKINLGGFDFDICAAINHIRTPQNELVLKVDKKDTNCIKSKQLVAVNAVSCIPFNPDCLETKTYLRQLRASLSPSSSEAAVTFMKDKSPYVKSLCRLAKFWQCSVPYGGYISGRSYLFEIIAVR